MSNAGLSPYRVVPEKCPFSLWERFIAWWRRPNSQEVVVAEYNEKVERALKRRLMARRVCPCAMCAGGGSCGHRTHPMGEGS